MPVVPLSAAGTAPALQRLDDLVRGGVPGGGAVHDGGLHAGAGAAIAWHIRRLPGLHGVGVGGDGNMSRGAAYIMVVADLMPLHLFIEYVKQLRGLGFELETEEEKHEQRSAINAR